MKMTAKRIGSFLLAAAMLLGMVPAVAPSVVPQAAAANVAEYISLPITIRDYANDGMLFEFNELGDGSAVASSENPSMAHTSALFNPTYRILNGGTGWTVANGTSNGSTAATSALNGYQTFTTTSETDALTLTYTLPTGAGQQLQYKNRVSDLGYIVLTFKSSAGTIPGSITLTDANGATYTASYTGVQGAGAADSNDTGFVRAYYKVDDAAAESAVITSVTINTGHVSGQQVVTNPGELDYNYTLNATQLDTTGNFNGILWVDPTSGYAITISNSALTTVKVTINDDAGTASANGVQPNVWAVNNQMGYNGAWIYYMGGATLFEVLACSNSTGAFYVDGLAGITATAENTWSISKVTDGYTVSRKVSGATYYVYVDDNGTIGVTTTSHTLRTYNYLGTSAAAPEYGEGSGPATFSVMEVEFFNELDAAPAQLRCMGTDGSAVTDANGNQIVLFWSQLGNTHANNTYTLWTTVGNNKNYGFLQSDIITSSDPQTTGTNKDDDPVNVNSNWMDDLMTESEYINPSGTQTITLNNGVTHTISGSSIRTGLVQPVLGPNKQLVYEQGTVYYMMEMLKRTLAYEAFADDSNGVERRNFSYVLGTKVINNGEMDLATAIRKQLGADSKTWTEGTYADAKAKFESGGLAEYTGINTIYDAAYFLLHSIYADNIGYGQTIEQYEELRLDMVQNTDGTVKYVFNSDYTTSYENGIISNPDQNASTAEFDPIKNDGYGITGSPYIDWVGDSNKSKFDSYNFNMSLEGHAQFIYYYDDNLYFSFSGDDDVYLFINDKLVMDLGAVHGDSNGTVYLNDIAAFCGLEDGEAYDFDFYYMERHGHAAHFSVETNIQIVDPAMLTQKTGYQNGVEVGYNGYVNPAEPVKYSFQLTNNGEAPLKSLEFIDEDIGVSLSSSAITLNSETTYNDLLVAVYHTDGTYTYYPKGQVTDAILKETLATGLAVGERIIIHGFKYTIPDSKWVTDSTSGSTYFHNTVQSVGVAHYHNATTETLNGVASYRVQKPTYAFGPSHYYAWGKLNTDLGNGTLLAASGDITNSVTATNAELLALINSATNADTGISAGLNITSLSNIQICSASGLTTANYNTKATVNSDGTITYTATETGVDTYYFKATGNNGYTSGPIRVTVFTYGVADNVYVLDYSLPVELNGVNFGLTTNDVVYLADNPFVDETDVTISVKEDTATSNYGTFTLSNGTSSVESVLNGQSLKYTMTEFMSGIDSATITIVIKEGTTTDNRTNGVTMTQKLEVVPASVVYYEDDFVDITYVNSKTDDGTGNVWAEYVGENGKGTEQSANQESNYGSDPNYSDDSKWGSLILDEDQLKSDIMSYMGYASAVWEDLKNANIIPAAVAAKIEAAFAKYMDKLEGTASNGTIHELILSPGTKNTEIMYFDFKGTGFELISRATQDVYAVLTVRVQEGTPNADGTFTVGDANGDGETTSKVVPVITESKGGDVYEVPIIKIDGLPYSNYKVTLSASNVGSANREIYVDGIRIYNPLGDGELENIYYASDEAGAKFFEIRPLIVTEKIVYMDIAEKLTFGTGTTVVENIDDDVTGSIFQIATSDSSDYLNLGPNNEIYLDAPAANAAASILAFYVTKASGVEDAGRTLQIGVHRKIDGTDVDPVYFVYGSTAADIAKGIIVDGKTVNYLAVSSGTEQYITIDPANLTFDSTGKALVLVGTIGGENPVSNVLALTNIKIAGYAITSAGDDLAAAAASPAMLEENELVQSGLSLRKMMFAAPAPEETIPDETVPDETVPDETVPDETVPDETVPDETVPDVTVPDETVPDETVPDETVPDETVPDETVPDETAPAEPAPEEPAVNEDLSVVSAEFLKRKVKNGSEATLTVTTSAGAAGLLILDEDGNEISYTVKSCISSENGGILGWFAKLFGGLFGGSSDGGCVYTVTITVEGKPRENKAYQIYAVDENGAISGNSQTASVTIR